MRSIEICSGGGGQALGLEQAGFSHEVLIEVDANACETLRTNRPSWNVICDDVRKFSARNYKDIDLFAAGVPCPPFSHAGKQFGGNDERDLFPEALRIIEECRPKAVILENVRGMLDKQFEQYRRAIDFKLGRIGYRTFWKLLHASDYGVSQLRPRIVIVALKREYSGLFSWPEPFKIPPKTVGELLFPLMKDSGWSGALEWAHKANRIAPTIVGGSKKHGGADLGPTRSKLAWKSLGVDAGGIADSNPEKNFEGLPRLTLEMAKVIQGFPLEWEFSGGKTSIFRQIGNAFPPPVAAEVGKCVARTLKNSLVSA